jgi:hypothetical protein
MSIIKPNLQPLSPSDLKPQLALSSENDFCEKSLNKTVADALHMPGIADMEFELPRFDELPRPADLT